MKLCKKERDILFFRERGRRVRGKREREGGRERKK